MKFLSYIILFLFPAFSYAQDLRFSVLTGPSLSWMRANNNKIVSSGSEISWKVNVQGEYWFNDRYGLTGGIGLSIGQGGGLEYEKGGNLWKEAELSDPIYRDLPVNSTLIYHMNYIDIPFGFKLRTNEFGKYRFYIHAPEFSISIRTKARGDIDATNLPFTEKEDIREMVHFFTLFYAIGVGTEIRISQDIILLGGLRFNQSFTDITDDSGTYSDGGKESSKGILSSIDFRFGVIF